MLVVKGSEGVVGFPVVAGQRRRGPVVVHVVGVVVVSVGKVHGVGGAGVL